ncbi:MAG: MG2 domain-containing protein [Saprospiraceae bacterium]|nr:MG2 domain-containing protein [Saprospiraceae bacterium]MDW8230853.1 MG2 domain-containing protein [Saprospiraceae bacterium]
MTKKAMWLLLPALLGLWACKKSASYSDAYLEEVARYVSAYTGGGISRSDAVVVRFAKAAVGREQVGQKVASGIWSVSPSIPGDAVWQDEYTLRVQPKEPLVQGKHYTAKVALNRLFGDVSEAAETFEFSFGVRPLAFEVEVDGLRSVAGARQQQVVGRLHTSDPVEASAVEQALSAQQGSKRLTMRWTHSADGKTHEFAADDVERSAVRSKVELRWSGKSLGLSGKDGSQSVTVPGQGEFALLHARIVRGAEPYVLLNFSDPVSTSTDLAGLIRLDDADIGLRFAVNDNFVRVYPREPLSGKHRLIVEDGLRSAGGAMLDGRSEWPLDFGALRPQVRLVGNGAIVPKNSDGQVLFPFEATGLRAVDVEIFKIFQSNILQFLQTNDIEGESELERVGKIIHQQKIALSDLSPEASSTGWQRYAFDLSDFIKKDPGAIYQVRLSFRRSYAAYACPVSADEDAEEDLAHFGETDEDGRMKSLWGGYRGVYYSDDWEDGEEYEWENRDNPCAREYYHSEHFAARNVFVSDLGITAKWGRDRSLFLCTTDLLTAEPEGSVKITMLNYQLQPIAETQTGSGGTAYIEKLRETPFLAVATRGDHRGYLRLADGASLSLSRFDVAGVEAHKGLKGYLYGERGVWRPGDSLYLNFVLEDRTGQLPPTHPVSLELRDPRGTLYYRTATAQHVGGVYAFHCATRPDAPTGNWTARVEVGGAAFNQTLKIETVKPNRLKIEFDLGKKILTPGDENRSAALRAAWLHGAPAAGLQARVEMQLSAGKTEFKNFGDFVFDDPTRSFWSDPETIFDGYLDESGRASVPLRLGSVEGAPGRLVARFKTRVFERGGDFSTDNFAVDYCPYPRFVGVSIPADKGGYKSVGFEGGQIQVACVDASGNPQPNRRVSVGLYLCDWRWWWDENPRHEISQFNTADHMGAVAKATLFTNSRGIATWNIRPTQWGRYLVRAVDEEGGHASGDFFWTGYPDDRSDLRSRQAVAMLPFSVGKDKYTVGEKVTLRVPASEKGRILLTLENGSRVLEHRWFDAKAGDNALTFEATAEMTPNIYAHVSLFQPYAQTANDLPIRMYGVMPVMVENPATRLKPQLEAPAVIRPGQPFAVSVRETSGKACTYTLAVVDEGLLDLTRFQTPNPWDAFFAREAIGVKTWDVYDHVLGAFGASMERILSVGGDAINQKSRNAAQVSRFKPVVRHLGPFRLEKGQTAKHQLTLDNYIGSVRVMAVCSAPASGGKGAYGSAEKTCAVRKPVMVLPTLPRVLGPGETVRLPVEVFAVENSVKSATVRLSEKRGTARIIGPTSHTLSFAQPGSQMVYFDVQVGNKTGDAQFVIEATGGGETAKETVDIAIRNPNPVQTQVWDGAAEGGREWSETLDLSQYANLERLTLEVSALPPINLSRHLDYLLRYPHGCIEQITSGAFPQLYADLIAPLSKEQQEKATRNISSTLERLHRYQTPNGAFAYWPGGSYANSWSDIYAGHFLLEAKAKGYAVSPNMLDPWLEQLAQSARRWTPGANDRSPWYAYDDELTQAYRLYALALAGKPELGAMNRLKEQKNLYKQAALLLAAAYAQAGKAEVARDMANKKWREDWNYEWGGRTFASSLRDQALQLETYTAIGDKKRAETLVQNLCQQLGGEPSWEWNTQGLAVALRALSKYVGKQGTAGPQFTYQFNGGSAQKGDASKPIAVVDLSSKTSAQRLTVKNTGKGRLYIRVVAVGQRAPDQDTGEEIAENIALSVRYLDASGNPIDVARLPKGADFIAEVTVKRNSDLGFPFNELALSQIFPSGWEIQNARLSGMQMGGQSPSDYQDIRDDRAYTYFSLPRKGDSDDMRTYRIQLNAAYAGRYYLPPVSCEAMYDSRIRASTSGRWVEVL